MIDLDMSPYGPFVWGAYGLSALVLGGLTAWVLGRARGAARALAQLERADGEDAA